MEGKLEALFTNEDFTSKFEAQTDVEGIRNLFVEYGADLTDEELAEVLAAGHKNDELAETDLDAASGGIFKTLGSILGATWGFACDSFGGPKEAAKGIATYWYNVLTRKR